MRGESVNHPAHYSSHPSGVECIDVIRHYTCDIANAMKYLWRAGLKSEEGMSCREKEIEDCRKALWYLEDYLRHGMCGYRPVTGTPPHPSGIGCEEVARCYEEGIAQAFRSLWNVGLVAGGVVYTVDGEEGRIATAMCGIRRHIDSL